MKVLENEVAESEKVKRQLEYNCKNLQAKLDRANQAKIAK